MGNNYSCINCLHKEFIIFDKFRKKYHYNKYKKVRHVRRYCCFCGMYTPWLTDRYIQSEIN